MSKIDKLINYAYSTNIDNVADLYLFDIITYRELEATVINMHIDDYQTYLDNCQKSYDDLHAR